MIWFSCQGRVPLIYHQGHPLTQFLCWYRHRLAHPSRSLKIVHPLHIRPVAMRSQLSGSQCHRRSRRVQSHERGDLDQQIPLKICLCCTDRVCLSELLFLGVSSTDGQVQTFSSGGEISTLWGNDEMAAPLNSNFLVGTLEVFAPDGQTDLLLHVFARYRLSFRWQLKVKLGERYSVFRFGYFDILAPVLHQHDGITKDARKTIFQCNGA